MYKKATILIFLLCILLFSSTRIYSQTFTEISGTVKHRGAVLAGVSVNVRNISGTINKTTITDNNGFYKFTMLPVDRYIVRASVPAFTEKTFEVSPGIGQATVLYIELDDRSWGSVSGKITVKEDEKMKNINLSYWGLASPQNKIAVSIGSDGKFNISRVPEGTYILSFEAEGFQMNKEVKVKKKKSEIIIELKLK